MAHFLYNSNNKNDTTTTTTTNNNNNNNNNSNNNNIIMTIVITIVVTIKPVIYSKRIDFWGSSYYFVDGINMFRTGHILVDCHFKVFDRVNYVKLVMVSSRLTNVYC